MKSLTACLCLLLPCLAAAPACAASTTSHWVTVNGHRLHFIEHGAGPPVLLLHGGGNTPKGSFSKQMRAFADHHLVIAPEQIGHGKTPALRGPLSYTQMMQDTAALLRQLHLAQTDVVGWSDGAIIGLMLAVHHPDLVRRVVVSGANFTPDGLQSGALTLARTHASSWLPPFAPTSFRTLTFADRLGQLWGSSPTADELSLSLLAQVTQPVLVMAGEYDVIKRAHTQAIYDALPSAKLWILPATSHNTFGERAEWVNPVVLSFLDE